MQPEETGVPAALPVNAEPAGVGGMLTNDVRPNAHENDARMAKIEEILGHTAIPHLEKCELVAEWVRYAEAKVPVSGQIVHKPQGGRPEGGIAWAARQLPIPGKTDAARYKFVQRAIDIDSVWPEAKSAVRSAKLDNIQSALLAIATERSPEAQLAKVEEIAARRSAPRRKPRKSTRPEEGGSTNPQIQKYLPQLTARPDETITAEQEAQLESLRTSWRIDGVLRRAEFGNVSAADPSSLRQK